MIKLIGITLCLFFVNSCVDKSDPEKTLRTFINFRFDGDGKRDAAIDLTTGELRSTLEKLKGDEAKTFWNLSKQAKRRVKVNIKNCQKEVCFLTYTLKYLQKTDSPNSEYDIETKKIAKLEKIEDNWLISNVSEVKTYIDSKVELK